MISAVAHSREITSERTPPSWLKSALASVVSRMRFVAAAVAAIIMSYADRCLPADRPGLLVRLVGPFDPEEQCHGGDRGDGCIVRARDCVNVELAALDRDDGASV